MKEIIANTEIKAKSVRLVTDAGSNVVAISEAQNRANAKGLDLVQVNAGDVPVVKIMDLNKYKFEMKQAEKEAQRKQRQNVVKVKEVQFSFKTQENDLSVKAKSASKFLSEGHQVRIVMAVEGRVAGNQAMLDLNKSCLESFAKRFGDVDFVQKIEVQGKKATCVIKAK